MIRTRLSRREAIRLLGAAGAVTLAGCNNSSPSEPDEDDDTTSCVVTPLLTEGPFFLDQRLDRASIVGGQQGLPLELTIVVYDASVAACTPLVGVQVDVWHANAVGDYSGVGGSGGTTFLRGFQLTGGSGMVMFSTIYPGWYQGRATHIHVKVRRFDAAGNRTLEATTQLFFDDSTTDAVYAANGPYNSRGGRDTRNSNDGIFPGSGSVLLALAGSVSGGLSGGISLGVQS